MRLIDNDRKVLANSISIYLSTEEAKKFCDEIGKLLQNPEANEHFHILDNIGDPFEISCSIITEKKLSDIKRYNKLEQTVLQGIKF